MALLESYNRELTTKTRDQALQLQLLQQCPTTTQERNGGADSFSSKTRNDRVIRNWNDLHKQFLADGVDIKTAQDVYGYVQSDVCNRQIFVV